MANENLMADIRKKAVSSGLLLGLILLVLSIFTFYLITALTTSIWVISFGPLLFSVILPIIIAVFMTKDLRTKVGGYWNFKQATTGVFIMFFIATVVSFIGRDLIFAKLIEPDMVKKTQQAVIGSTTSMMEKSGADQSKIDEQTEMMEKQFEGQGEMTPANMAKNFGISVIVIFVFALIFGAIFKKEPPLFTVDEQGDPVV